MSCMTREQSFFDHLADLRRALVQAALAYALALAVAFPLAPRILIALKRPLVSAGRDPETFLLTFHVTGGMSVAMTIALWGAFVLALPFMVLAAAGFVYPGLTPQERRVTTIALSLAGILFAVGAWLAYVLMLPAALRVMLWFNDWMGVPVQGFLAQDYARFALLVMASFGIAFEIPLGLMILGWIGILSSRQLRRLRRHAIVGIMILAAVVTPTTDPFSLLFLAIPLTLLYELSVWTTWIAERRRSSPSNAR